MTDEIKIRTTEMLWDACESVSAYEVAEDLQIVAEKLGKEDEGWKKFAKTLRAINDYVGYYMTFPSFVGEA